MENYIEIIQTAVLFFPVIALIISIPFVLSQYHKFGSISVFKTLIIYSFTLYLICTYFLVILPLPNKDAVRFLTTPRMQLLPLSFVFDFLKELSERTKSIFETPAFYVPLYNIFLTLPFGMYLRYYFKCNFKKVFLYSFLLSLFFELTQLSGLYFIYPRGYRLFDVDDLLLNTLGGIFGYVITKPLLKILPKRERIDIKAREKGMIVSGFRRTTAQLLDLFFFLIIIITLSIFTNNKYLYYFLILIYYIIMPIFFHLKTPGERFLNLQVLDYEDKENIPRFIYRRLLFIVIYLLLPSILFYLVTNTNFSDNLKLIIKVIIAINLFFIYNISIIKYIFTNKEMYYEKLSKTKLSSTIGKENNNLIDN